MNNMNTYSLLSSSSTDYSCGRSSLSRSISLSLFIPALKTFWAAASEGAYSPTIGDNAIGLLLELLHALAKPSLVHRTLFDVRKLSFNGIYRCDPPDTSEAPSSCF